MTKEMAVRNKVPMVVKYADKNNCGFSDTEQLAKIKWKFFLWIEQH